MSRLSVFLTHHARLSAALSIALLLMLGGAVNAQTVPVAAPGFRAPPPNDFFLNRQVIPLPYSGITLNIDEATVEAGEPVHMCPGPYPGAEYSVWFEFTVPASGQVFASTQNSNYIDEEDNIISIYDTAFNTIACNDINNYPNDEYGVIEYTPIPAGTYYIFVSAYPTDVVLPGSFLGLIVDFIPDLTYTPTNTLTFTPTDTFTPTFTPTPTATFTRTFTPTFTASRTPTITPTFTATNLRSVELVINGGFEDDIDSNAVPDSWQQRNTTGDKRKCNQDGKPPIAHSGACVYQFKSGVDEQSKLYQDLDLSRILPQAANAGDTLLLDGYIQASGAVSARVKIRVIYIDVSLSKGKVTAQILAPTNGYQAITNILALELAGEPATVRLSLMNRGTSGKVRFDDLSVILANEIDPRSGLQPLPAAP
ncbi:MAG: PPC domain-containing protein [Armatimonadetes bacterium]|nr:PPC domain-containing protein [Anaerolineae bacterium]